MQADASPHIAGDRSEGADAQPSALAAAALHAPIRIDPEAFYTERATAALLGVALVTVRRYRREGSKLPFSRYGREVYYLGSDIINMLKGGRQRSTSDARA